LTPDSGPLSRPTRAVVDLAAIARNYRFLRGLAAPAAVFPVVKADAYGHGAVPVSRRLQAEGADRFAVAIVEEGIELRRAGVSGPILILNYSDAADVPLHHSYGLVPVLHDLEQARAFAQASRRYAAPLKVHLKIDTGMGRLGILPGEVRAFAELLRGAPSLALEGTLTQLARADETSTSAVSGPLETMKACLSSLRDAGIDPGLVHAANSAALLVHPDSIFQAVRPGLALYGIAPGENPPSDELEPALELETRVMAVKTVSAGTAIGYGGRFVTTRPSRIATLPIGYHDGVRRSFSGRVCVLLRGGRVPIVGAVSMDMTSIDATDTGAAVGDRVVLLGRDGGHRVTAWDLARGAETIPYEIVCGIGARVPRAYR
jgi:alanine racemase